MIDWLSYCGCLNKRLKVLQLLRIAIQKALKIKQTIAQVHLAITREWVHVGTEMKIYICEMVEYANNT